MSSAVTPGGNRGKTPTEGAATPAPGKPAQSPWNKTLLVSLGAALAVAVVLLAFVWPTVTSSVKDLPVVVVGSGEKANALQQTLSDDGRFDVEHANTRDDAWNELTHRDAYAAFVVTDEGSSLEVITATAGSPAAAQLVAQEASVIGQGMQREAITTQSGLAKQAAEAGAQAAAAKSAAATLQGVADAQFPNDADRTGPGWEAISGQLDQAQQRAAQAGAAAEQAGAAVQDAPRPSINFTDAAPLSEHDPRGAGLALLGLPLAMGGMIGGLIVSLVVSGFGRRITAAAGYGVVGGLLLVLIMQPWFGLLQGNFALNWLAMGLGLFATAMTIVGLESLIGRPGIAVGAILTMFVGNPLSSLASPPEFLPWIWGSIGQWFVPGATGNLLRDISYFPEASTAHGWIVLACWSIAGLLFATLGRHRDDSATSSSDAEPEPAPVAA